MKGTAAFLAGSFLCAGLVLAGKVSIKGQGTVNNQEALIIDEIFAEQGSPWDGEQCVWWTGNENITFFIVDFGKVLLLKDILLQVDNNDDYAVEYSEDGKAFSPWLMIKSGYGEIGDGMDTLSSDADHPDYVQELDFEPVNARFIKIYAVEGDSSYSVSELQFTKESLPVTTE